MNDLLTRSPYEGYAYSYPHKTAYAAFPKPRPLEALWKDELARPLMLYVHVPFCEFRCGFCNLFTERRAPQERAERYIGQLEIQAQTLGSVLGSARFEQLAIGGGTPTALSVAHLSRLLAACARLGLSQDAPKAIETSPATISNEHIALLEEYAFERVSIGVQAFDSAALAGIGRPQKSGQVSQALDALKTSTIPVLNIDLIYGAPGQSLELWLATVRQALHWQPEELYLYPLYIRAKTGLDGKRSLLVDPRLAHYRAARDLLLTEGYVQHSMRMFSRREPSEFATRYRCQDDGMLGLGCGARSYTRRCHYSDAWAVSGSAVETIVDEWMVRDADSFRFAHYGVDLSADEERRRYLIQSLLQCSGMREADYEERFGGQPFVHFPSLTELLEAGFASWHGLGVERTLRLSDAGIERSDLIGPWLYSPHVRNRCKEFTLR